MPQRPNKTLDWQDLQEVPVARWRQALTRFLWRSFVLRNTPVAVNGILRRRMYIRRLKMWEYARGLAALPPRAPPEVSCVAACVVVFRRAGAARRAERHLPGVRGARSTR